MELIVAKPVVEPSPAEITEIEDAPSTTCKHKNKKSLFKLAEIRKKVKSNVKKGQLSEACDECLRNDPNSNSTAQWLCVTCGFSGCDKEGHTQKHFQADRSGVEHTLFFSLGTRKFKCFCCNMVMDAAEETGGPMKAFLNDYCAFRRNTERHPVLSCHTSESKTLPLKRETLGEESILKKEKGCNGMEGSKNAEVKGKKIDPNLSGEGSLRKLNHTPTVKGLMNLGNTCFFNSTMQCLMHTYTLGHYVDYVGMLEEVEIGDTKVHLCEKQIEVPRTKLQLENFSGSLNKCLAYFIHEFNDGRNLHPSELFSEIAKKAPRFRGWAQQDAHELLRYLMDGLRSEELQRYKNAISVHLKIPKGVISKSFDPEVSNLAKAMLKACGRPLLDAIFGGTLLQAIKCSKCGHLSCIYEEFLDLSIPIPSVSSSSKFLNGALKIHNISKHQKKKEKQIARKRLRRKSRRESASSNRGDAPETETPAEGNVSIAQNESDLEEDDDAEISDENELEMENLCITEKSPEECLQTLGEDIENQVGRSLYACLSAFTSKEILSYPNAYECEKCCVPQNKNLRNGMKKKTVDAEKRYFIYEPPTVLTLHLKRFEQHHYASGRVAMSKVRGHVAFPLILDIASFCTSIVKRVEKGSRKVLYALYGIVSHSGDLSGGHYIAYVRSRLPSLTANRFFCEAAKNLLPENAKVDVSNQSIKESENFTMNGEWYYVSDSRVSAVDEAKVLDAEAYILFYERIA